MATSCKLEPVMNAGSVPGQFARGNIFKVAPLSSWSFFPMLLLAGAAVAVAALGRRLLVRS